MDFCEDARTKKVKLLQRCFSLSFLTSFVPYEINRPFRFKGYTYPTLHVMEEDNRSLGEYVAIELTPKQQTVCVCVCVSACVRACVCER